MTSVLLGGLGVACGKTKLNDAAADRGTSAQSGEASGTTSGSVASTTGGMVGSQSSGASVTGGAGGTTGASSVSSSAVTTGSPGPVCTYPTSLNCDGECFDPITTTEHCGYCTNPCPEGQECVAARCEPPLSCDPELSVYEAETLEATGGEAEASGWLLSGDAALVATHTFQEGPSVLRVTASGRADSPRPLMRVTVGTEVLGEVRVRSTEMATYAFDYQSQGNTLDVSLAIEMENGAYAPLLIDKLEIEVCTKQRGLCPGGGFYRPDIEACSPPVCSEAADCGRDFLGPEYAGACEAGTCRYPRCDELTAAGVPLHEELSMIIDVGWSCFTYDKLVSPLNSPRTPSIEGSPDAFECPSIESMTWEIERFAGEGSCVHVPQCGPERQSQIYPEGDENSCCYIISRTCGV